MGASGTDAAADEGPFSVVAATDDAFCRWCGRPAGTPGCDQVSCRRPLDPPRCCPTCGRRLRVLVTPAGVRAACRDHGTLAL